MSHTKRLTVQDLIAKLTELVNERPDVKDMEVWTEGCDCDGDAGSVIIQARRASRRTTKDVVYIQRANFLS